MKFYKGTNAIPNAAVTIPNTSGWNQFTQLAAPGDLTGDGQPDILGATPGGDLYLYTVTSTPGATPTITGKARIAAGWNRFKEIVTTGDLTRDGKPDVLAIDRNTGDLLLYAGTGQSTLAYTTTIATGWHGFNNVTGLADFNKDGYPDLAAVTNDASHTLRIYNGQNNTNQPISPTYRTYGAGWNQYTGLL